MLRPALASHGVPERIYVDNGSAFVDAWLLRACAVLGVKLTHSTPGRPRGRGKSSGCFSPSASSSSPRSPATPARAAAGTSRTSAS